MHCPRCDVPLATGIGAVHESACGACGGRFLPRDVVLRVVVEEQGIAEQTLVELAAHFGGASLPCPSCKTTMRPVRLRGVGLDLCGGCGGVWCDKGELARLTRGLHDEIAAPAPSPDERRAASTQRAHDGGARGLLARVAGGVAAAKERVAGHFDRALTVVDDAMGGPVAEGVEEEGGYVPIGVARAGAEWCVVQESTAPLDVEPVRRALAKSGRWTATEAMQMVRAARGVLADALTADEAALLQRVLAEEGVRVDVARAAELALPPARRVTRLAVDDAGLHLFDVHGRSEAVPWVDVVVVGLAARPHQIVERTTTPAKHRGSGRRYARTRADFEPDVTTTLVDAGDELVLEVLLERPPRRVRAGSSTFVFGAPVADRAGAFTAHARAIAERATHAASAVGDGPVERLRTARALERELSWWWRRRAR